MGLNRAVPKWGHNQMESDMVRIIEALDKLDRLERRVREVLTAARADLSTRRRAE